MQTLPQSFAIWVVGFKRYFKTKEVMFSQAILVIYELTTFY